MEQILIEPLRAVKLTHTGESVLITKEDNLTQDEWEKLKIKVEKIATAYREPFLVDVELKTVLNKTYLSVKDKAGHEQDPSAAVLHYVMGEATDSTWGELAKILEVELQIEGYSVTRTEPEKDDFIRRRKATGNPVPAKIMVEDDCITIGVNDIFHADLPTIDVTQVMNDIHDALKNVNGMLKTLTDCMMPFSWTERKSKEQEVCKIGTAVSGAYVYGVAELKHQMFKIEELTIAARTAKRVLEAKGYKVEAERSVRVTTKLDL